MKKYGFATISYLLYLSLILAIFPIEVIALDQARVILYDNGSYGGPKLELTSNVADLDDKPMAGTWSDWNNDAGSIRVYGGAKAVLYDDDDYRGTSQEFKASSPGLGRVHEDAESIRVFLPNRYVSKGTINFGNLYLNERIGAETYNKGKKQTFSIKNSQGESGTTLHWEIQGIPKDGSVNISPKSRGTLTSGASVSITVRVVPKRIEVNKKHNLTVHTSNGNHTLALNWSVYDTSRVSRAKPALGANNKVHVAVGQKLTFGVAVSSFLFPSSKAREYEWAKVEGSNAANFTEKSSSTEKNLTFSTAGTWAVHARMSDNNRVATPATIINVQVWNRPSVKAPESLAVLPSDTNGGWNGKGQTFVGRKNEAVKLSANADLHGNKEIVEYQWDFNNDWSGIEKKQTGKATFVSHKWDTPSLSSKIYCKAIALHGIESKVKVFNLKIYGLPDVQSGGPYDGRPTTPIMLKGSINKNVYPSATFSYQWKVKESSGSITESDTLKPVATDPITAEAKFSWDTEATYQAQFSVLVTTVEGLKINGMATTDVTLEAGVPTPRPDGSYIGGIYGGNFSPIQFRGNRPNVVQGTTADGIGEIRAWEWANVGAPEFSQSSLSENIWNPTQAYNLAGSYKVSLNVKSQYGKWGHSPKIVTVIVKDGKITGYIKAADLRTPVKGVTLTLKSNHVDKDVLDRVAAADPLVDTIEGSDGLTCTTNGKGFYIFEKLPLGNYQIVASKIEGENAHEFEKNVHSTKLTLQSPNQLAIDFVDLSVYPIGGRVYYSLKKQEGDSFSEVLVQGVKVTAQPIGNSSSIAALPSKKSKDGAKNVNYSMPLFAGKYLFLAERAGHDIRLIGTNPSDTLNVTPKGFGYDLNSQLVTIEGARNNIHFIDYTTRTLTVHVEDSGGFPIDTINTPDDEYKIKAEVVGTNGYKDGEVEIITTGSGSSYFRAIVPPGKYTVSLKNVPSAIAKADPTQNMIEVDLTGGDDDVTMVVPVQIELEISPAPRLIELSVGALSQIGLTASDNPEGYMVYYPPDPQTHTYTIRATANGRPVTDFTLDVTDDVSRLVATPAPTKTYPDPSDSSYTTEGMENKYQITAGLPNFTIVDEENPDSYVDGTLADGTQVKLPKVLPKKITFQAKKDRYKDSILYTKEVTILGDVAEGSAAEIVAIPNVNYLVLHDPPGDESYSYLDDSMRIKGMLNNVTLRVNDVDIPVYPSPWSVERDIDDVDFDEIKSSNQDLANRGLLGYRDSDPTLSHFTWAAAVEGAAGMGFTFAGPLGYAAHMAKMASTAVGLASGQAIQYEVSPNRRLETPSDDNLVGPGKGDIYYGEGWTVGLQSKYRLGIKKEGDIWVAETQSLLTYDILERANQYIYTIRDISKIINDLTNQISAISSPEKGSEKEKQKKRLEDGKRTWERLLSENPAYRWRKEHVEGAGEVDREALKTYLDEKYGEDKGELLIFSAGTSFDYSRQITEANLVQFSTAIDVSTDSQGEGEWKTGPFGLGGFGPIVRTELTIGGTISSTVATTQSFGAAWESGTESEQTIGFVLKDNDVGDNISTYVYEGPWGTPIFFTDPGSVTSDPWQKGTNKAVNVKLELISAESNGPFDYREGAHYQFQITSTGKRKLEGAGIDFVFYDLPIGNPHGATVKFNGSDEAPYKMELFKGFVASDLTDQVQSKDNITVPSARITVSIYPPQKDWDNSEMKVYPVLVQTEEEADYQIAVNQILRPQFADLRSPQAIITAPYDGQRISPNLFADNPFKIHVFSDDQDVAKIQLQIRSKRPDAVWGAWGILAELYQENGSLGEQVTVVIYSDRKPQRKEFTVNWTKEEITSLGVGEYALRAVAKDQASRLSTDGDTQTPQPNQDLDAPIVTFSVDSSKPTVLTSKPFYQDPESDRNYQEELSVTFNDDMRADDFSDQTFEVTDLLDENKQVAGYVSYGPALRKAVFVPVVPFSPNGYYRVLIKTDTERFDTDGNVISIDSGVHDLAGNPLDNAFSFKFRTKGNPFEEKWQLNFSVTAGNAKDRNNIAAVAFGSKDGEDENDARAVPRLGTQLSLSFLLSDSGSGFRPMKMNSGTSYRTNPTELDRDVRPADGRLSHHWFFVIDNAGSGSDVTIKYRPSIQLKRRERQYQVLQLVSFNPDGTIANVIKLDPSQAEFDLSTGQINDIVAHQYTASSDGASSYFRLDVQKSEMVSSALKMGTTGWIFFSVPIIPQKTDPFVNLGDDIDPFKLYQYDSIQNGYKIYPLDLGEVALQNGHAYFTRLETDVEIDVGGTFSQTEKTLTLVNAGWHTIGNPFQLPINIESLKINNDSFNVAVNSEPPLIEAALYSWKISLGAPDQYHQASTSSEIPDDQKLQPWAGYWVRTLQPNLQLTIPAPAGLQALPSVTPDSFMPSLGPAVAQTSELSTQRFELQFALTSETSADLTTALGTYPKAKVGRDRMDLSEPPRLQYTVSAYFEHLDWARVENQHKTDLAENGQKTKTHAVHYNSDYRPILEVGESSNWKLVTYTDEGTKMKLSWADSITGLPDDTMLYFRSLHTNADLLVNQPSVGQTILADGIMHQEWQDMRRVKTVSIDAPNRITNRTFEIRAEKFKITPPTDFQVISGEAEAKLSWSIPHNPFIDNLTISRQFVSYTNSLVAKKQSQSNHQLVTFKLDAGAREFIDSQVEDEATYRYQLGVGFKSGATVDSNLLEATILPTIQFTRLMVNYPNPFNPETWLPYELENGANVAIEIHNPSGRMIRRLQLGVQSRGRYQSRDKAAYWNGRTEQGEMVASGVYFYTLIAGEFTDTRKMVILK